MEFAEELNQKIIVQMIHTLGENGIRVGEEEFIRDLGSVSYTHLTLPTICSV